MQIYLFIENVKGIEIDVERDSIQRNAFLTVFQIISSVISTHTKQAGNVFEPSLKNMILQIIT